MKKMTVFVRKLSQKWFCDSFWRVKIPITGMLVSLLARRAEGGDVQAEQSVA